MLLEYIADLEERAAASLQQLKDDKVVRRFIERTLHLAVEACLDIGNHLIADLRLREPYDYKDIMLILVEAGYLPAAKLAPFQKMVQFRNVAYIKPDVLLGILQKGPADLRLFAVMVRDNFLRPEKPDAPWTPAGESFVRPGFAADGETDRAWALSRELFLTKPCWRPIMDSVTT